MPTPHQIHLPGFVLRWLGAVLIVMSVACGGDDVQRPRSTDGGDEEIVDGDFDLGPEGDSSVQPLLTSIDISPAMESLRVGDTQQFTAVPKDSNGNVMQVTITWSSSDTTVGSIDGSGLFSAKAAGTTTISAASGLIAGKLTVFCSNYYYVSALTGDDANPGTSEADAWRTIAHAATRAQAGDTVFVQGGNYGHEHVVVSNSGTAASPIVFQGYSGVPIIDGQDQTGYGIYVSGKKYFSITNINVSRYQYGVFSNNAEYVTMDSIEVSNSGHTGINMYRTFHSTVSNSIVTDSGMHNFWFKYSDYNVIDQCSSYGIEPFDEAGNGINGYYFIIMYSSYNTIQNSLAQNKHASVTGSHYGHGFIIKDNPSMEGDGVPHSHDNQIIDSTSRGMAESFVASHKSHDNYFVNVSNHRDDLVTSTNYGFRVRNGAYNNVFRNCRADGFNLGIASKHSQGEGGESLSNYNNRFVNCIITNVKGTALYLEYADNTRIENCVITKSPTLVNVLTNVIGTTLVNDIVTDVKSWGTGNVMFSYSDFYNNGFSTPSGTGIIGKNPFFADPATGDFHLKSQNGRWDGSRWVYDAATSPAIDAGDPASDYSEEPQPNGGRVNMGAFGNTAEASLSDEPTGFMISHRGLTVRREE